MNLITLTHANTSGRVDVATQNIFYMYWSQPHAATHVVAPGGAYFPVKESVEQIKALISGAAAQTPVSGGDTHDEGQTVISKKHHPKKGQ